MTRSAMFFYWEYEKDQTPQTEEGQPRSAKSQSSRCSLRSPVVRTCSV